MKRLLLCSRSLCMLLPLVISFASWAQKSPQQIESLRKKVLSTGKVAALSLSENRQTPDFISFRSAARPNDKEAKINLSNLLGARANIEELVQEKETKSPDGDGVISFQQVFKGLRVDRATFKAFVKGGKVNFYNGAWYDIPSTISVKPAITMAKALEIAKADVGAKTYAADEIANAIRLAKNTREKHDLQRELLAASASGELVMINDFTKPGASDVRLAWKFNIYAAVPLSRSWVYVDAVNGKILLKDAIIKHVDDPTSNSGITSVSTSVQTRYAGSRKIQVKQISGNDPNSGLPVIASNPTEVYIPGSATYALIDDTRGNGIETYDLNGVGGLPVSLPVYSQGKSFTDVNNSWSLAEHKRGGAVESENDDIAWDAHWGAGIVYDYWKARHNRSSFDGNNAKIKSYIHSGLAYDNAFWNGSVMTYGDGSGTAAMGFKPLTSLDVCGHEIGHGVCEFTSNLVYAKESGAMNEGLSDIWASCIEYFAIKTVDAAFANSYKPFYIGEQISADPANPLRRMDNPKAQGNPDTYGGINWTSQEGCTPSLANDQCGVHSNSGVLNKWFYLLTVGSGAGSGPNASFAGTDDGINDAVTTGPVAGQHPANTYSVTGLGFAQSEKITFLTEQLLSASATYAEARQVSIAVATELSGNPCSAMVESVTNAWYAVGVGGKFIKPCSITYGFVFQPGAAVDEAATPAGCVSTKLINVPVLLPANSTATVSLSGSATNNIDYTLSATSLSNTTSSAVKKSIVVTVINDGSIEGDENVTLTLTVSNTGTNKVNKAYKLTLLDDDVVPVIASGEKTLLNETFTRADGFTEPAGWTEKLEIAETATGDPLATGKNQWGVFDNKLAITGKEGLTGTQLPNGTYNNLSESQTIVTTGLIDARGLSLINIKFDYRVQGEIDPAGGTDPENFPALDYLALAYSLDGSNFIELSTGAFRQFASLAPASGTISAALPASLANKQFYLGFRWKNDANAGGPVSVSIDNLLLTGSPRKIEKDLSHNGKENLSAGQQVYFYSVQDGELLAKIKNNSASDFGCTNVFIEKAGTGTFNLYQSAGTVQKVSNKIHRIQSANSVKASTTVTLFYTNDQLLALEQATGKMRNTFSVYQVTGLAYSTSSSLNTIRYTPVYAAITGVGASYTVTFNEKATGSFALGSSVAAQQRQAIVEINSTDHEVDMKVASVYPNPVKNIGYVNISLPVKQVLKMEVLNANGQQVYTKTIQSAAGKSKIPVPASSFLKGSYRIVIRDEKGKLLNIQQFVKE